MPDRWKSGGKGRFVRDDGINVRKSGLDCWIARYEDGSPIRRRKADDWHNETGEWFTPRFSNAKEARKYADDRVK